MLFRVSQISSAVELVFSNADDFINVYPSYHQKGDLIYRNVDSSAWEIVGARYVWETTLTDITSDTIPVIQLIYSYGSTTSDQQQQYAAFKTITAVETIPGKLRLFVPTRPTTNFRIRYRILNKIDLAIPLNRLFGVGLGYDSGYSELNSFLTAFNPVSGQTMSLSSQMPVVTLSKAGIVPGSLLGRIQKLEDSYNRTLSKPYQIEGYASETADTPISTNYSTIQNVQGVLPNTWYGECEIQTHTDAPDFTTADYLFYQQQATGLNLTHVYTSKVTTFRYALAANSKLKTITGLELLDTHEATDISYMFAGDTELRKVDLSSLCLDKVTFLEGLFKDCSSLEMIDARSLDFNFRVTSTASLINQADIFTGVPNDCVIWVSGSDQRDAILSRYPNLTGVTYN